jgi:thioredoxin-like negative regulator of GroEL
MNKTQQQNEDNLNIITKNVISRIESRDNFLEILKINPGLFIMKLGAPWCRPCKQIAPIIDAFFGSSPKNVLCADINVDESFDLYSFLKSKRMVNGIPAILCYQRGNVGYVPNDMVTGADPDGLHRFFKRCGTHLNQVIKNSQS